MNSRCILISVLFVLLCDLLQAQTISVVTGSYCVNSETVFILSGSCSSYSWSVTSGVNGVDYSIVGSTNGAGFRVKWLRAFTSTARCSYVCGGSSGIAMSPSFTVGNYTTPSVNIAVSPGSTVCQGTSVTFTATPANGGSSPGYNWRINGATVSTGSSVTFTRNNLANGDVVTAVITANVPCGTVSTATSNSITMNVTQSPAVSVTINPPSAICSATPSNASFSAIVTNGGSSPVYSWYKNGNPVTDRTSGPPANVYVPKNALATGDRIKCRVTSNASCVSGNPAMSGEYVVSLAPSVDPTVNVQIPKLTYCSGETITFTASSSYLSGSSTYLWRLSGNLLGSAATITLPVSTDVNAANTFSPGDIVTVGVTGLSGACLTSSNGTGSTTGTPIVIYPLPSVTISPVGSLKIFSNATQNISASGSGYTYQWKKDGVNISPGGTANPYAASVAGVYSVVASANGCSKEFGNLRLTKNVAPVSNAGSDQTITLQLPFPSVTLNGSASDADGSITSYLWKTVSGPNSPAISNLNSQTAAVSDIVAGTYVFGLTATDNFGEQSAEDLVTVSFVYPPNNFNWIRETSVLLKNKLTEAEVSVLQIPNGDVNVTWNYFDGIGRPIETVSQQGSPAGHDILVPNVYDRFGREWRKYLPTIINQTSGHYVLNNDIVDNSTGNYKGVAADTYAENSDNKIPGDIRPFSETTYEPSPINRALKELGPGKDWFDNDKAVNYQFITNVHGFGNTLNEEKVIVWRLNNKLPERNPSINSGFYPTGSLTIKLTKDENGNQVREYQDCLGRIILKKVQVAAPVTSLNSNIQWALTYYIYDDFGNLVFVFQPELSKTAITNDTYNPSPTDLHRYAFQYTYDQRQRIVVKKVPGADSVFVIYDSRNRIILTQDGNQRKDLKKEWSFTKYDALNRPVITGIYTHGAVVTRKGMISAVSSFNFEESYNGVSATHGYTNVGFPASNSVVLSVTYYDNYKFKTDLAGTAYDYVSNDLVNQDVAINSNVKGQVTGTKINLLGSSNYLWFVKYYDAKYRVIQTKNQNQKNRIDRVTNLYDFSKLIETRTFHTNITTYSAHRKFEYDHLGRIKRLWHKFHNESSFVLLTDIGYNERGELVTEKLHSRDGLNFAQTTDYLYNIRGWLEFINDPVTPGSNDLFSQQLRYNTPSVNGGGSAMFNGNISEQVWKSSGYDRQAYGYKYDPMDRFNEANYFNQVRPLSNGKFSEKAYNSTKTPYDLNGNINGLVRHGRKSAALSGITDQLKYTYVGNQLTSVNDTEPEYGFDDGFKDAIETSDEYTYDSNGNMLVDQNKGITAITYNHLNLPVQVNFGPINYIVFTYDANGQKLTQKVFGSQAKTTEYIGEFVYENTGGSDVLKFVNHDRGRIVPDNSVGAPRPWEYQYYLKDHLGNVRVTFSDKKTNGEYKSNFESATQPQFRKYNNFGVLNEYDHTDVGTVYIKSHLLHGGNNSKVGLSKSIEVSPGDVFDIEVYAKYENQSGNLPPNTLDTFLASLVSAFSLGSGSTPLDGSQALTAFSNLFPGGVPWITSSKWEDDLAPKAYLNYILFDENFALVDFGFDQISVSAKQAGIFPVVPHDYLNLNLRIAQKGYLYVYLSNENAVQTNVYFDDFKITFSTGIEQAIDYYPFGLTYNSYQRQNSVRQNWKFQGQEHIDDLNLGWDSFKWRNYQPDIARFFDVDPLADKYVYNSPYAFAENKLGLGVELEGLEIGPMPYLFFSRTSPIVDGPIKTSFEVGTKVAETGSKVSEVTPKVPKGKFSLQQLENFAKGNKSEAEQLAKNGYQKNTKPVDALDPKTGQKGTTTPDALPNEGRSTVEVKNVKQQGLTRQLRLQNEFSNQNTFKPELIINQGARLSTPLQKAGFDIKYYSPAPADATRLAPLIDQTQLVPNPCGDIPNCT